MLHDELHEKHAKAVDVALGVFWINVVDSALIVGYDWVVNVEGVLVALFDNTKVCQLCRDIVVNQDIGGFDVPIVGAGTGTVMQIFKTF